MTGSATIDWFGRWGTAVFSENTAIFDHDCAGEGYLISIAYYLFFVYLMGLRFL